jgi:hypothetical protein
MSDQTNAPPIAANASHLANLSPESVSAAKQSYLKAGYSVEQIAAAFGTQSGKSPIVETPRSSTMMAASQADGLTQRERESAYRTLLDSGTVDRDTVLRAAAKDGVTLSEAPSKEIQQANAEHQILKGFEPPARPENYNIELPDGARDVPIEDIAFVLNDLRNGFHAAGVPATMGAGLAAAIFSSFDAFDTEAAEAVTKTRLLEEGARVRKLSSNYSETARLAEIGIAAIPEATRQMIYESYGFHTAEAFIAMSNFGRIIEERQKRSGK